MRIKMSIEYFEYSEHSKRGLPREDVAFQGLNFEVDCSTTEFINVMKAVAEAAAGPKETVTYFKDAQHASSEPETVDLPRPKAASKFGKQEPGPSLCRIIFDDDTGDMVVCNRLKFHSSAHHHFDADFCKRYRRHLG